MNNGFIVGMLAAIWTLLMLHMVKTYDNDLKTREQLHQIELKLNK